MMFNGYGKKPRFGDVSYGTPPIYDPTEQGMMPAEPAAKPGFLARDGLGVNILGGIADAVSTGFGGAPVFGQQQAKRDQWTQTLQMKALERKQALDQWQQQQIWKRDNPEPSDLQQRVNYLDQFKPGLGGTYAENYAANGGGAPQITTIPGVGTFAMPRNGAPLTQAPAADAKAPDEAVARLRSNPAEAAQFDEIFGAGASARYLQGGAPSQGGATFR